MKLRQLVPVVLMFVGASAFANHKHIIKDTHHVLNESKNLIKTFRHNIVKPDKRHLIMETKRFRSTLAHFNRLWHKRILGFNVGHKHKAHRKMLSDLNRVRVNLHHMIRRFKSKPRPHHVKVKVRHLQKRFHDLQRRVRAHVA